MFLVAMFFFHVKKFKEYGKLSGKKTQDLIAGTRVKNTQEKENVLDFVLWKKTKPNEPSWSSPWGDGRPGWHIECSAMCIKTLGESFDIHGGGPDLKFPHHENEIAQAEAATGKIFAKTWMHAGALRLNDEKMSKSLGNFFTIRQILQTNQPEAVRFFLISSHYRSQINFNKKMLKESSKSLKRLYSCLKNFSLKNVEPAENTNYEKKFCAAMDDDFNTAVATSVLFELTREINSQNPTSKQTKTLAALLVKLGGILGIIQHSPSEWLQFSEKEINKKEIEEMIEERNKAQKKKDFTKADKIRSTLEKKGIQLLDSKEKTTWQIKA